MDSIDQKINTLFQTINSQKLEVEESEKKAKQKWETNCSIVLPGVQHHNTNPINIQTASESTIKIIVMELLKNQEYETQASKILGIKDEDVYRTYTYKQWFDDCKKRIASISLINKKTALAEAEKRLNAIVSPEQKRQMELKAIEDALST